MNFQDRPAKDGKIESGNEDGIMAVSSSTEERTLDENAKKSNLSITLNSSDLADDNIPKENEPIYKHKFTLNELYQYSLQFYKKEKDNVLLSYVNRIRLVALWKQATCGKYDESKLPEIGYFDVIGNDRKKTWQSLGDMKSEDARKEFCKILEGCSPSYETFIQNKRREIDEEIERKRLEEIERQRKLEEERLRKLEEERIRKEEEERIRLALEAERLKILEEEKKKSEENEQSESQKTASTPTLVTPHINGNYGQGLAPASLWTRPKLQEFVNHVKRDASSVLVVGRGETVTIRVPTHDQGSCLFWEFATETYDIGFGVYFQWSKAGGTPKSNNLTPNNLSVEVNESDNDSTAPPENQKQQGTVDPIVINENENNKEINDRENVGEVLPVLRRNSHEEVIVGSHLYPGQGIYLLKFDNSYSLLRSKTLYYRVYYTK